MGYLPEERGLYKKLSVKEQLMYLGELKGLGRSTASERADYWLDRFQAGDWGSKKTQELSKGMQQKVQFIATILPEPRLVILDEPFSGLDPLNSELLKEIVLELRDAGKTVLFASHRMEQVERMCEDICLMSKGRVVLQGSLREIKQRFGRNTVELHFSGSDGFVDALETAGRVRVVGRSHSRAELRLLGGTPPRRVLETAMEHADEIYRFELAEPPLTEIFVSAVRGEAGQDGATTAPSPAATEIANG